MSDQPHEANAELTPEEAKAIIEAIGDVEREEAAKNPAPGQTQSE